METPTLPLSPDNRMSGENLPESYRLTPIISLSRSPSDNL